MNWHRIFALAKKDMKSIVSNKMVLLPMVLVPVLLAGVIPGVMLLIAMLTGEIAVNGAQFIEEIIQYYTIPGYISGLTQEMLFIFMNYSFLPMFMIIPLMAATVISANSVVGEKERKTLETLLYTPITNREFLWGKLASAFIPGVLTAYAAFLLYFVCVNGIFYGFTGHLLLVSPIWIPAMVLLVPAVSLLGLAVSLMVSLKAKSFMEAQQTAGIVVLPLVLLVIVQITGVLIFNSVWIAVFSGAAVAAAAGFLNYIAPKFTRESIISRL
ncbi:MAG: ABC transporter permease subunit [Spirochaetia bacterium]